MVKLGTERQLVCHNREQVNRHSWPFAAFGSKFISAVQYEKLTFAKDLGIPSWTAAMRTLPPLKIYPRRAASE